MKTITANYRTINIIKRAIENGFEIDENERMEDIRIEAEDFLIANTEAIQEECEIVSLGNHGQRVDWSDGKGFDFWTQGEIVDFSQHWHDAPDTKVVHSTIVDSEGQVVELYYLVGETDYNAPDGYYYSAKQKKHIRENNEVELNDGQVIVDAYQHQVFQTREEALAFGVKELGWDEADVLDRKGLISVKTDEAGIVDITLECILVDAGSEDYLYYIS